MNALLFPGQGSQQPGMGKDLYENFSSAKMLLDNACDILGYNLKKLMFEGASEQLTDTKYAQPVIYTCSAMYLEKLKNDGIDYEYTAGHSLGEYNALLAAEVFNFEEGLKLVARRGEAMAYMNGRGTMAAVIGLEEKELEKYIEDGVTIANLNSKTQVVISGEEKKINLTGEHLDVLENVRFKKLNVSAAFHSSQMNEAAEIMRKIIEQTNFKTPICYVVPNVTGKPIKDVNEIRKNLILQITGQVRWYDTVMALKEEGVTLFYEVGYGDVLKKLNKTIIFRPKCIGC